MDQPPRRIYATAARLWRAATASPLGDSDDIFPRPPGTYLEVIPTELRTMIGRLTAPELYITGIEPPRVAPAAIPIPHYELDGHRLAIVPSIDPAAHILEIHTGAAEPHRVALTSPQIAVAAAAILIRDGIGNITYLARRTYEVLASYPSLGRDLLSISPHGELLYYPNMLHDLRTGIERTVQSGTLRVCDSMEYTKKPNTLQIRLGGCILNHISATVVLRYDNPLVIWNNSNLYLFDTRGKSIVARVPCPHDISMGRAVLENGTLVITTSSQRLEFALRLGHVENVPKTNDRILTDIRASCQRHQFRDGLCAICGSWEPTYY